VVGTIAGAIVGAAVFAAFVGLGFLLSSRVGTPTFVPVIVLGAAGAYAGWLVGVIVFGAVRGSEPEGGEQEGCDQ
jgi:hypothetical protein